MKFLGTFIMCAIVAYLFLFFGGAMIFQNLVALIIFIALLLTVSVYILSGIFDSIEALEKRCKELEDQLNAKNQ